MSDCNSLYLFFVFEYSTPAVTDNTANAKTILNKSKTLFGLFSSPKFLNLDPINRYNINFGDTIQFAMMKFFNLIPYIPAKAPLVKEYGNGHNLTSANRM